MNTAWLPPSIDGIPRALRARPWVLWAAVPAPDGGKPAKIPRQIADPSRNASSTDPATWGTFDDAWEAYSCLTEDPRWAPLGIAGIGVVLTGDGLVCIDLDGALTDEGLTPDTARIVRETPTFCEVSPSRRGLHLWISGTLARACTGNGFEAYDRGRFICVTGERYPGTPEDVEPAPRLIQIIDMLTAPPPSPPVRPSHGPARVRRQQPIRKGTRDNDLYRIASALVQDGFRGVPLVEALVEANGRLCQPPLPQRDVQRIARSAERRR